MGPKKEKVLGMIGYGSSKVGSHCGQVRLGCKVGEWSGNYLVTGMVGSMGQGQGMVGAGAINFIIPNGCII